MDTQTRHEEEILKLRQDVRELKALNRRSAWMTPIALAIIVFVFARPPRDENKNVRLESGELDVVTSLTQNRLAMSTLRSNLRISNSGTPEIYLSDPGGEFALTIKDGKLVAITYRGDGTEVENVLVDGNQAADRKRTSSR